MGTRSLTRVFDEYKNENELVSMYRQFDGYLTGHGAEVAEFLKDRMVINGIPHHTHKRASNGMGDLAAQLIHHFKNDSPIGSYYIVPIGPGDHGQEYEYWIYKNRIKVYMYGNEIFDDTWDKYVEFINHEMEEEEHEQSNAK